MLLDQIHQIGGQLADQLTQGWALLCDGADHLFAARPSADTATQEDRPALHSILPLSTSETDEADPEAEATERTWRRRALHAGVYRAPVDFAARVRTCLPSEPPPFDLAILNPYAYVRRHSPLVACALGASALVTFGASWLIAIVEPSLAFAILAALVSVVILLAEGLRFAWETTAGAASNPLLVLVAMSAPVIGFLIIAPQLTRWTNTLAGPRTWAG